VLLTNGWGRVSRSKAAEHFKLDAEEFEERHHLTFSIYEEGKLTLDQYLSRVVFYEPRSFSRDSFIEFMYSQSASFPGAIDFFKSIKKKYGLRVIAVSNEGKELNAFRIRKFGLADLFDAFISSCFVHLRKPDADIFRMAIEVSQAEPARSVYIDDRLLFVEIAQTFGLNGLHFRNLESAKEQLREFGFSNPD
jgi:putative hydrolase of the HAD superfamily